MDGIMRMKSRSTAAPDLSRRAEITIEGDEAEIAALERMLAGACLVGAGRDGVALTKEVFEPISLRPDPLTSQHWPAWGPDGEIKGGNPNDTLGEFTFAKATYDPHRLPPSIELKGKLADDIARGLGYCVSVFVWGLTGYDGEAVYEERAWKMREVGFVCLRSPRDESGKIWEKWFLPGTWCAKGPLKGKTLAEVCRWLCHEVRPGSIDLVQQRFALVME